jgi:hypothetical protein
MHSDCFSKVDAKNNFFCSTGDQRKQETFWQRMRLCFHSNIFANCFKQWSQCWPWKLSNRVKNGNIKACKQLSTCRRFMVANSSGQIVEGESKICFDKWCGKLSEIMKRFYVQNTEMLKFWAKFFRITVWQFFNLLHFRKSTGL